MPRKPAFRINDFYDGVARLTYTRGNKSSKNGRRRRNARCAKGEWKN